MVNGEEICVACKSMAIGNCGSCGAALCPDHDFLKSSAMMLCADQVGCEARMVEAARFTRVATEQVV